MSIGCILVALWRSGGVEGIQLEQLMSHYTTHTAVATVAKYDPRLKVSLLLCLFVSQTRVVCCVAFLLIYLYFYFRSTRCRSWVTNQRRRSWTRTFAGSSLSPPSGRCRPNSSCGRPLTRYKHFFAKANINEHPFFWHQWTWIRILSTRLCLIAGWYRLLWLPRSAVNRSGTRGGLDLLSEAADAPASAGETRANPTQHPAARRDLRISQHGQALRWDPSRYAANTWNHCSVGLGKPMVLFHLHKTMVLSRYLNP